MEVATPTRVSREALRALAGFGLVARQSEHSEIKIKMPSASLLEAIRSSYVVLIAGASGAGKSCLLRGIERAMRSDARTRVHVVDHCSIEGQTQRAIIDLLDGSLDQRLATLASAGLGEPKLWAMPPACLSMGERSRLILALAMHRARAGDVVIADEFCSMLDRTNAYSIARTIRRWAVRLKITLIVATAHEDMESLIGPDLVVDMNADIVHPGRSALAQPIIIEPGTIDDFHALAHLHYLGAKPATHTMVLRAVRRTPTLGEILAGVLVISMPTLNGAWRQRAWGGFFSTPSKALNARRLNAHLRCISRVIVEPRSRGLGVASTLVGAYLDSPQTCASEAIAAMGSICPFFERATMVPYPLLPAAADLRFLDALEHEHRSLTSLISAPIEPDSLVERELITWSKQRKLVGSGRPDPQTIQQLAPIAACRLLAKPRAYAHLHNGGHDGERDTHNHTHT